MSGIRLLPVWVAIGLAGTIARAEVFDGVGRPLPTASALGAEINVVSSAATIEAGEENDAATIRFAKTLGRRSKTQISCEVSSPIDDGERDAELATLDGMAGTLTLNLNWSGAFWTPPSAGAAYQASLPICQDYAQHHNLAFDPNNDCESDLFGEDKAALARFHRAAFGTQLVYLTSIQFKAGRDTYEFNDPTSLESQEDTLYGFSGTAAFGLLTHSDNLWSAGFRAERSYKEQDKIDLCSPIPNSTTLVCESGRLGSPDREYEQVLYAEYRRFFHSIAINPRVSHGFHNDVTGVDVPVYFLKDADNGFTGGVRAGWRSDTDDLSVSVFVGAVLRLWD